MQEKTKVTALIAAAGSGTRMKAIPKKEGGCVNKILREIGGIPIIAHTVNAFEHCKAVDEIVLVTREADIAELAGVCRAYGFRKVREIVAGGSTRQASVYKGLCTLTPGGIVLIHDGARALVTPQIISRVLDGVRQGRGVGVSAAVRVKDSIKRADENGVVSESVPREGLYSIQTPQGFYTDKILDFHRRAAKAGAQFTDDCMAAEFAGETVVLVEGDYTNIKITTEEDLAYAEFLMKEQEK